MQRLVLPGLEERKEGGSAVGTVEVKARGPERTRSVQRTKVAHQGWSTKDGTNESSEDQEILFLHKILKDLDDILKAMKSHSKIRRHSIL